MIEGRGRDCQRLGKGNFEAFSAGSFSHMCIFLCYPHYEERTDRRKRRSVRVTFHLLADVLQSALDFGGIPQADATGNFACGGLTGPDCRKRSSLPQRPPLLA